jgi:hypothetical protein
MDSETDAFVASLIITAVAILASFGFGIAEAVILSASTEAKHACGPAIWYCILVCCILHFLVGLVNLLIVCGDKETKKKSSSFASLSLAVTIWAMMCYYDTSDDCTSTFKADHADLWKMLTMEVVLFYISMGLLGLLILMMCCVCCCSVCGGKEKPAPTSIYAVPTSAAGSYVVTIGPASAPPGATQFDQQRMYPTLATVSAQQAALRRDLQLGATNAFNAVK